MAVAARIAAEWQKIKFTVQDSCEFFKEFLHSSCWLYPVIRFFAYAIDGEFEVTLIIQHYTYPSFRIWMGH